MRLTTVHSCLGLALLCGALASPTRAQFRGYEATHPSGMPIHGLHEIDPDTGMASVPAENAGCNLEPADRPRDVDFNSGLAYAGSVLHGLDWDGGSGPDIYLVRYAIDVNDCTAGTRVGATPVGFANLESLAYCPADGFFYSASFDDGAHVGRLIKIDPATGVGVVVGSPLPRDLRVVGMAHDPATGGLLALGAAHASQDSKLWRIDKATAVVSQVGLTGIDPGDDTPESLALDLRAISTRILIAGTTLYELNPATGAAKVVGGSYPGTLWAMAAARESCDPGDRDGDGDGTPDCDDGCPDDANKTAPGECGCGKAETGDSDGDGVHDCNDGCPDDMNKTAPGECDCGNAETGDSDGDGVHDCNDPCPDDADKTAPGECGCGNEETGDSDGDGVHDCNDGCPDDADKTAPGECGCGNAETGDSDSDGVHDCNDRCPDDANKTEPGDCGCGTPETRDSDGDGVPDCNDACPSDRNKVEPGDCGCGLPDVDVNGDTVSDCDCQAGDVHPHGTGDGVVDLVDWLVARRVTELGSLSETPNDLRCGDQAPGVVSCHELGGTGHWCVSAGDGAFDSADTAAIRPLAAGIHVASCEPCLSGSPSPSGDLRLPGDTVPNGLVDVGDVLQLLRWAVMLDPAPTPVSDPVLFSQADIAPSHVEGDLAVVDGDERIDVGDVLLLLRDVVGLIELAWRERTLQIVLRDDIGVIGFSAGVSGWPAWARVTGFQGSCAQGGGVDEIPGTCVLTCASDPATVDGPDAVLGAFLYRGQQALDPGALTLMSSVADAGLEIPAATVELVSP